MPLKMFRAAPVEDTIHGVIVRDPYRWLENRDLPETRKWLEEQRKRCENYFADCGDLAAIRTRVLEYLDVEVVDQPAKIGDRYFYRRRNPKQEQACIYVREAVTVTERLLVDPSDQGPFASVGIHRISDDGSLLAYEVKHGGEDRKTICFLDVESGRRLPGQIEAGYARGQVFAPDNRGFFYCHETSADDPEHKILFHLFHKSVSDQVVFREARTRESRLVLTADSVHLGAIWIHPYGSELAVDFFIARSDDPFAWKSVFVDKPLPYSPILKDGRIFALSYSEAPNGKLVELNTKGSKTRTVIDELETPIRQIVIAGRRVFASYLQDLVPSIRCWTLSGESEGQLEIPIDETIQLLANHGAEDGVFYTHESFSEPLTTFEYLPAIGRSQLWHRRSLPARPAPCYVRRASLPSRDGTAIPMMLVARRPSDADQEKRVIMTGYGGFGAAMTPRFSALVSIMIGLGVTFALPQIRGGGEFGNRWRDAARGRHRQTAFDDFIASAEWLCATGETSPQKLAIFGGSNSGLVVGAAMTRRPDLFRAVLCIAPLLDMVRYEQFDRAIRWRQEYGAVDSEEDFNALHAYSPYHQVRDAVDYPAVLFVSGDKDDRCDPAHVRKMAARLQLRQVQTHAVLVDYSPERGHSVLPLSFRVEALVRRIAFLCRELSILVPTPGGSDETVGL
jgi:prolyl oligopeptidase